MGKRLIGLAGKLYRLVCMDCSRIVWPWQPRCGVAHRTCQHTKMIEQFSRVSEAGIAPQAMWPCSFCGAVPQ